MKVRYPFTLPRPLLPAPPWTGGPFQPGAWSTVLLLVSLLATTPLSSQGQEWTTNLELSELENEGLVVSREPPPPARRNPGVPVLVLSIHRTGEGEMALLAGEFDPDELGPSLEAGDRVSVIFSFVGPQSTHLAGFTVTASVFVESGPDICLGCTLSGLHGWAYLLAFDEAGRDGFRAWHEEQMQESSWGEILVRAAIPGSLEPWTPRFGAPDEVIDELRSIQRNRLSEARDSLGSWPETIQYLDMMESTWDARLAEAHEAHVVRVQGPGRTLWATTLSGMDDPGYKGLETQFLYLLDDAGTVVFSAPVGGSDILWVGDLRGDGVDAIVLRNTALFWDGSSWVLEVPAGELLFP